MQFSNVLIFTADKDTASYVNVNNNMYYVLYVNVK